MLVQHSSQKKSVMSYVYSKITLKDCVYTPCFCEENVWNLCNRFRVMGLLDLEQCKVVFVSNKDRCVALWRQRAGLRDTRIPVIGDYHCFAMHNHRGEWNVFDLDSTLAFPENMDHYYKETFCPQKRKPAKYNPKFRVIDAEDFMQHFASDRSHMKNNEGIYLSPAPRYPPIRTTTDVNNLNDEYIKMYKRKNVDEYGDIFNTKRFMQLVGLLSPSYKQVSVTREIDEPIDDIVAESDALDDDLDFVPKSDNKKPVKKVKGGAPVTDTRPLQSRHLEEHQEADDMHLRKVRKVIQKPSQKSSTPKGGRMLRKVLEEQCRGLVLPRPAKATEAEESSERRSIARGSY